MKTLTVIFAALAVIGALSLASPGYSGMYDTPGLVNPSQSGQSSIPDIQTKDFVFGLRWSDGSCMTKTITASSYDEAVSSVKRLCTNCSISDIASYVHGSSPPEMLAKSENFCPAKTY